MNSNKNQKDKAFETHVREQLQQRTLEPSTQAWDRLDAMLTVAERPRKNFLWWYAVAAIFVLGGVLGLWKLQQQELTSNESEIVLEESKSEPLQNTTEFIPQEIIANPSVESVVVSVSEVTPQPKALKEEVLLKEVNVVFSEEPAAVEHAIFEVKNPLLETKSEEGLAVKSSLTVDPQKLLNSVEREVEIHHRNTVIESINKNYQTFKQALATRNLE
jgi:hypothetical protein